MAPNEVKEFMRKLEVDRRKDRPMKNALEDPARFMLIKEGESNKGEVKGDDTP